MGVDLTVSRPVPVLTVMLPSPPSVSWNWKCCLDSVLSAGTFLMIISTSEPLMRVTSCPSSNPTMSTLTALQFWTPSWLHWTRLEASLLQSSVTRNFACFCTGGKSGMQPLSVQKLAPSPPQPQVLQSCFHVSPSTLWFPSQSRHTATGSVLRSAEVEAAAEAPGKLMLAPLEASLPVLVWEEEDDDEDDEDDDDDDEDSSSVQNLRVQPGTRLSRHRHLLQSTIQVSPACLGSPRLLVPHWLAGRVSLDLSSENIASLVVVASTSSSGRQNLRVQPGTRLSRHRHLH